ncbi:MAG: SLC5 family protein [Planctomycetota bacterium]
MTTKVNQILFVGYALTLLLIVYLTSRREKDSLDYFLAGRGLSWWVIGASLIASNISTEHFVGMAGSGFSVGLAVASYEWMAAVTLVLVGRWFLPVFLRHGVYTMPEYLEVRFCSAARIFFSVLLLVAYIFIVLATVLYSGGLAIQAIFGLDIGWGILILSVIGGAYTIYGGLKAVVFTDVLQVVLLLAGGAVATWLGLRRVGGFSALLQAEPERFHTILPAGHSELPWTGVFLGGLWMANFFYWGCNQFITQRTLAARSLAQGQRGILLAAFLKLGIPFLIVVPGIVAHRLYGAELASKDMAYPHLLKTLLPSGLSGLMLAALLGAVLSTVDSLLNSAATLFTMDLYAPLRRVDPQAEPGRLLRVGRWSTLVILLAGALWAPMVGLAPGVFRYIQEFWGVVSPGVVAVFLLGFFWKGARSRGALWGLGATIPVSLLLWLAFPEVAFLNRMGIVFALIVTLVVLVSLGAGSEAPSQPRKARPPVDMTPARGYAWIGWGITAAVGALYWTFA